MTCVRVKGRRGKPSFLCTDDPGPLETPNPECPNADQHEPWPSGYIASSVYAEEMMSTHVQSECPRCGLWLIWTPKEQQ
jgi:hypothetical protein